MTDEKKEVVEISEEVVEQKPEVTEESLEGLSSKEKELARKHNMVSEKKEGEKRPEDKKEERKEIKKEEATDFEKVSEGDDSYKKFNPNEKALYHRWKEDKKKRQEAVAEKELLALKIKSLEQKLNERPEKKDAPKSESLSALEKEYNDLMNKPDDELPTYGEMKRIRQLEQKIAEEKSKAGKTQEDDERRKREAFQRSHVEKLELLEKTAKEAHPKWEQITELAKKVMTDDKDGVYFTKLNRLILSDDPEENKQSIDYVIKVARLHPEYEVTISREEEKKEVPKEKKEEVEKIENNLTRKVSSASVSGGGSRAVSEDELTLEDAIKLSPAQYARLKPETRKRLLGG
jgi:hypothetical protein